jgi:hypothetical protein
VSGFERQRLIERVHAGLNRARRQGKTIGRPGAPARLSCSCGWLRSWWRPVRRSRGGAGEGVSRVSLYCCLSESPVAAPPGQYVSVAVVEDATAA